MSAEEKRPFELNERPSSTKPDLIIKLHIFPRISINSLGTLVIISNSGVISDPFSCFRRTIEEMFDCSSESRTSESKFHTEYSAYFIFFDTYSLDNCLTQIPTA